MKRFIRFFLLLFMVFFFSSPVQIKAASGNLYSLVVTGTNAAKNDGIEMTNVLKKNKAYDKVFVSQFTYDTEAKKISAGTRKKLYNNAIDAAYKKCTTKDTAFFFHSGHGMEGLTNGMGVVLKSVAGQAVSWYSYDDLLKKLCTVKCKHMIIIIHACESGAVYKAYNKLTSDQKSKISIFWSSASNQLSYSNTGKSEKGLSVYGHLLIQCLGGMGSLDGDKNGDGYVTIKELGDSINSNIDIFSNAFGTKKQTPGYYSAKNQNTIIYSYKKVSPKLTLNKSSVTLYYPETKTYKLKASTRNISKKIVWKSSNTKIASVNSAGKVTIKKAGTVTITATAEGVSDKCRFVIKQNSVKLDKSSATIYIGESVTLRATIVGRGKKESWKTSNKSIATVSSGGKVIGKKTGTVIITVTANGVKTTCKITVKKKAQGALVELKDNKTYLSYDFTRDGKEDKFWYTYYKEEPINLRVYNIYVNDKIALSVNTYRAMQFYFYQLSNKKTYLIVSNHYAGGGNSLTFYYYKSGKFVEIGGNEFAPGFSFYSDYVSKAQKNLLYVKSSLKFWNEHFSKSLLGIGHFGIELEVPYKVSDSKIQRASNYIKCLGNRRFQALDNFYTSKSLSNISKKDGPSVSANKIVTLEQICWISDTKKAFLISLDGKRGWFLDSPNARIKWIA